MGEWGLDFDKYIRFSFYRATTMTSRRNNIPIRMKKR